MGVGVHSILKESQPTNTQRIKHIDKQLSHKNSYENSI